MSQRTNTSPKYSEERQSLETASYSLDRYLKSNDGVTERLLKGFNIADVASRVKSVSDEVRVLAEEISQSSGSSS
ncbi:hypothetical protein N656DRAFT_799356 [Canariomyces notabilis]|uniref:Uncharacterized protein n=1 Tax=Canariomyces notabilis TaxID=2074819 RepID=A0AAN6QIY0_9PEZI|nr:hypothetical protein N656DRAFT_799356 [Canariomyces arenarius]